MAEGERGGGWLPPNDDDDERTREGQGDGEREGRGGLSSGDPLAGGWQPPSGGGASQPSGGWTPPGGDQPAGQWGSQPSGQWGSPPAGQWGSQPPGQWGGPPVSATNGKATAALVLGIVGIFVCPIVCSTLAIIFGYQSRREIDASQGRQTNRSAATAGIILGWIGIALGIVLFAIFIIAGISGQDAIEPDGESVGQPAVALAARVLTALPL